MKKNLWFSAFCILSVSAASLIHTKDFNNKILTKKSTIKKNAIKHKTETSLAPKFFTNQMIQDQDGSIIETGFIGLYHSTDGITFSKFTNFPYWLTTNYICQTPKTLYIGTNQGLYISNDNCKTFSKSNALPKNVVITGLSSTIINGIRYIYVTTLYNPTMKKQLYVSKDNGQTFATISNVINPDNLMVTKSGVFVSHIGAKDIANTYLSTDGVNFKLVFTNHEGFGFKQILTTKQNIMYAYALNFNKILIYESRDQGKTWTQNQSLPPISLFSDLSYSKNMMIQQSNGLIDIAMQGRGLWRSTSTNSDQFKKVLFDSKSKHYVSTSVFQARNKYIYVGGRKTFWSKDGLNFSIYPDLDFSKGKNFIGFFQGGKNNYLYINVAHLLYVSQNNEDFLPINFKINPYNIHTWGKRQEEIIINKYLSNATLFASEKWSDFSAGGGSTEWKCLTDSFHLINKDVYFYANMNYSVLNPPAPSETLAAVLDQGITYHFQSVLNPLFHAHKFFGSLNITIKAKI